MKKLFCKFSTMPVKPIDSRRESRSRNVIISVNSVADQVESSVWLFRSLLTSSMKMMPLSLALQNSRFPPRWAYSPGHPQRSTRSGSPHKMERHFLPPIQKQEKSCHNPMARQQGESLEWECLQWLGPIPSAAGIAFVTFAERPLGIRLIRVDRKFASWI